MTIADLILVIVRGAGVEIRVIRGEKLELSIKTPNTMAKRHAMLTLMQFMTGTLPE